MFENNMRGEIATISQRYARANNPLVALKYAGAKLDLITDSDMHLMFENNMRGEIATISQRYARANNPLGY